MARASQVVALVGALALGVAACSSGSLSELDVAKAKREITTLARENYAHTATVGRVTCPKSVKQEKDRSFTCTVLIDGQPLTVKLVQTDDNGKVHISQAQAVILTDKAESFIATEARKHDPPPRTVSCGKHTVIIGTPGQHLTCRVTFTDGSTGVATLFVQDTVGRVRYQGIKVNR